MNDLEILIRDKYEGDASKVTDEDRSRLASGEPLAYVIGWVPFLGLRLDLTSRPLIPRPETEWWTDELLRHLQKRFGDRTFRFLDLCAGSGAIGLSVLKTFPNAHVSFGELIPEHIEQIQKNIELNGLNTAHADVRQSDLFENFTNEKWNIIASNPPYIPVARVSELDANVTNHEPHEALFSGDDGLDLIRRISSDVSEHFPSKGELWMECDISNIEKAQELMASAERSVIRSDQYGRPRVLVSYFA